MITRIVRMTINPDKREEFLKHFYTSCAQIRNFEGCNDLQLYHDADQPNVLITFSKWESVNALNKYRDSLLFKNTWTLVKPLFAEKAFAFSMQEEN